MAKITKKQRGGGKTLLSTPYVTYSLVDEQEAAREALTTTLKNKNLKTYLARIETTAKSILKAHDLPTTWRGILPYTNNYELPTNASYAADILFSIHEVREFIKKGDATNAAYAAISLGGHIACNDAEVEYGGLKIRNTSKARTKKAEKGKDKAEHKTAQQERMKAIAKETFKWKPGKVLTKPERREINRKLLSEYQGNKRPTSREMWKYAKVIGLM